VPVNRLRSRNDASRLLDSKVSAGRVNKADATKYKRELAKASLGGGGGGGGGGSSAPSLLSVAASIARVGVDENIGGQNTLSSSADTHSTGSQDVKDTQSASVAQNERISRNASRLYSDLASATKKVSSSASEGFTKAAGLAYAASTDYSRSVSASQRAQQLVSIGGTVGSASADQAADIADTVIRHADRSPVPTFGDKGAATSRAVRGMTGDTPSVKSSGEITPQANAGAAGAITHTGNAASDLDRGRAQLQKFKAAWNQHQAAMLNAGKADATEGQGTLDGATGRVNLDRTAAQRGVDRNKAMTGTPDGCGRWCDQCALSGRPGAAHRGYPVVACHSDQRGHRRSDDSGQPVCREQSVQGSQGSQGGQGGQAGESRRGRRRGCCR